MNCKQAHILIHLHCGSDLTPADTSLLHAHLDKCAPCRTWQQRMLAPMAALHSLRDSVPEPPPSVWPAVSLAIHTRLSPHRTARRFNLQVAAISVCSLLLAAATIVQTLSAMRPSTYSQNAAWLPTQNASGNFANPPWLQSVSAGRSSSYNALPNSEYSPADWARGAQDF